MKRLGQFLLKRNYHAAVAAFVCTLLPLIHLPGGFIAAIIVGFITLCRGYKAGLFVLVWVALPSVSLLYLGRLGVFDLTLLRCAIVWLFAGLLRSTGSWRLVLEVGVVIAFVAVVGAHLIVPDMKVFWVDHLTGYLQNITQAADWKLTSDQLQKMVHQLAPIATGIAGFIVLMGTFVQLIVARWWQSVIFKPGALRQEFANIRMTQTWAIIITAAIVGAFFKVAVIIDSLPVLVVPFMIAGLSFLHLVVTFNRMLLIPLALVYIGMLFFTVYLIIPLALLGYADCFINFRQRFFANR